MSTYPKWVYHPELPAFITDKPVAGWYDSPADFPKHNAIVEVTDHQDENIHEAFTRKQLLALAKSRGLKVPFNAKKESILEVLNGTHD